jgi:hypothetical protein
MHAACPGPPCYCRTVIDSVYTAENSPRTSRTRVQLPHQAASSGHGVIEAGVRSVVLTLYSLLRRARQSREVRLVPRRRQKHGQHNQLEEELAKQLVDRQEQLQQRRPGGISNMPRHEQRAHQAGKGTKQRFRDLHKGLHHFCSIGRSDATCRLRCTLSRAALRTRRPSAHRPQSVSELMSNRVQTPETQPIGRVMAVMSNLSAEKTRLSMKGLPIPYPAERSSKAFFPGLGHACQLDEPREAVVDQPVEGGPRLTRPANPAYTVRGLPRRSTYLSWKAMWHKGTGRKGPACNLKQPENRQDMSQTKKLPCTEKISANSKNH